MVTDIELHQIETDAANAGIERLVVGAVIAHNDTVLLLERPAEDFMGGIFEFPSGKVESGETLPIALAREVAEETGLTVGSIDTYIGHFDYASGSGKPTRQMNFTVTTNATEPVTLTEHVGYMWTRLDQPAPVTPALEDILNRYIASRPHT